MKIEQNVSAGKGKMFYMNDGDNVSVSNALGVIMLELGSQWEGLLSKESNKK